MIVYYSKTNNTERFVNKLKTPSVTIDDYDGVQKFILITPTYFFGQVPQEVNDFLESHANNMVGVISCGNRNWGQAFGQAGNKISDRYGVPLLHKIELSGNKKDKEIVDNAIKNML